MSETCPRCESQFERFNLGTQKQFACKTILAANGNIRYRSPKCADLERVMWEARVASLTAQLAAAEQRAGEAESRVAILEGELANAAEHLSRVHPIATVKHIGLREVAAAANDVVEMAAAAEARAEGLAAAAQEVIDMNRQRAYDQYGDSERAESWSCVTVLRVALLAPAAAEGGEDASVS